MTTLTVRYDLKPPSGVDTRAMQACKEISTEIAAVGPKNQSQYYAELRRAVLQVKDTLGGELTQWRDVVGKAEISKETKKSFKEEDDEEEDDDEADA
ncbi:hypothetical protein BD626DRAFT_199390 [Schizophyllum amplum]|uniref:EKC/KEOPS complex subunit GON7 n=1 Tax=Schizophyllum amplum TaxID=97359 RepID=A0A550CN99_9AGAR|nr:hypothetical protein BD626DRAFT_199390 [Auriculariopsis ampla]